MPLGLSSWRLSRPLVPYLRLRNLRYRRFTKNQVRIDGRGRFGAQWQAHTSRCGREFKLTDSLFRIGCNVAAEIRPRSHLSATSTKAAGKLVANPSQPPDVALCGNLYCNRFSIRRLRRHRGEGPVHLVTGWFMIG